MLMTGPGTEGVLSEFYHYCCNCSYLNTVRITTLHLDFSPKLLPWGEGLHLLFPGTQEKVKLLTLGLASGCTKWELVTASFTIWEHSHCRTCLEKLGFNQQISQPQPVPGEGLDFQSLAEVSLKWTAFGTTPLGSEGKKVCVRPGKAVSAAVLFPQAAFSQDTHPLLLPACAFTSKQYECPFPQDTETLSERWARHLPPPIRLTPSPPLQRELVGMPGPWLESSSGFTASSAVTAASIL